MREQDSKNHEIVIEELERHLGGNASSAFYKHLEICADCRAEVAAITEVSSAIHVFQPDVETVPVASPAFYSRVASRINDTQQRQAWGLFSLGEVFFRRVAFASLMLLAALGSYLVTQESSYSGQNAAEIIAQHDTSSPAHGEGQDRDYMLVTLASYQQ